ncbi:MAG: hypothetical protein ABEI98_12700 [Halorhabdus sp.]
MFRPIKDAFNDRGTDSRRADGGVVAVASDDSIDTDEPTPRGPAAPEQSDGTDCAAPPIDNVFEVLKNQRRRYVLEYLTTVDSEVKLGELAEQIAAWECEKDIKQITSQERKRVYVGLYQCHLPKMDDVDAVSYNKPRGTVEAGDAINAFEQYLPDQRTADDRPFLPRLDRVRERFFG